MATTLTPTELANAAASAHDALAVSHQMMAMLREYTELEAQHATRLQALAHRVGDYVDRMRLSATTTETAKADTNTGNEVEDGDELRARQSKCVAVIDQVVTFLTRFGSMHRHLSDCLSSDLFDEWSEALDVQEKRVAAQEPELRKSQEQLQVAEQLYGRAHLAFQAEFDRACAAYAAGCSSGKMDPNQMKQSVQALLSPPSSDSEDHRRRHRSPSKAMEYVGSISRLLRAAGNDGDNNTSLERDSRQVAESIVDAEQLRQQCQEAFQSMHRLSVRHTRLCDSLHQEYACVQNECLDSTKTSICKLVIHVSAFTSNLQYDATQLFQLIEALHTSNDLKSIEAFRSPPPSTKRAIPSLSHPPPPQNVPLALDHVIRKRFPVMNERPRLLKHQNACHVLSV